MPEAAHEAMQQIADEHGLSLGDWLAGLHLPDYGPRAASGDATADLEYGRRRFKMLAAETARLFEMIHECVDCDPRFAGDDSAAQALSGLETRRTTLLRVLKHECPEYYGDA